MKTLKIENTRELFFTSKEQYLHFRKVWSQAVNSEKAKKRLVDKSYGSYRVDGWLTAGHHLIYSLLRGKDAMKGFSPITSRNKLENGAYINRGIYSARHELKRIAKYARNDDRKYLNDFLKPFDETVTPQMLIKLDDLCPKIEVLESNFGEGRKLAKAILGAKVKPITYEDMWMLYEEVA